MAFARIPDTAPIPIGAGLTVEQVRRSLVGMGHTQVETAQATVEPNGDIVFQRAVGGEKGV